MLPVDFKAHIPPEIVFPIGSARHGVVSTMHLRWVLKASRWVRKASRWVCHALWVHMASCWLFGYQHVGISNAKCPTQVGSRCRGI